MIKITNNGKYADNVMNVMREIAHMLHEIEIAYLIFWKRKTILHDIIYKHNKLSILAFFLLHSAHTKK